MPVWLKSGGCVDLVDKKMETVGSKWDSRSDVPCYCGGYSPGVEVGEAIDTLCIFVLL
jgi:hypothetical protein